MLGFASSAALVACGLRRFAGGPTFLGACRWALLAHALGSSACTAAKTQERSLPLHSCLLADGAIEAQCGKLSVPENRALPEGRKLTLNVAVVEALAARPKTDPLFVLVGGPGQAATRSGARIAQALSRVRRHRDIVLVDQRGTGKSNPLMCPEEGAESLQHSFDKSLDVAAMRRCLAQLDADPAQYSTPMAMLDLDLVRAALGYDQINLWGGSYGTRAALAYAKQFPEHTRRVVLDGAAPTELKLPLYVGRDGQRALDLTLAACAADAACATAFPEGKRKLDGLLAELALGPRRVTITHPQTGALVDFDMHLEGFVAALRGLLYVPEFGALLPLMLSRAVAGDWGPFVTATLTLTASMGEDRIPLGMFLSVVCTEDLAQVSSEEIEQFTRGNFFGRSWIDAMRETCSFWPQARPAPEYFAPNSEAMPTLVLSGQLDPVLPPEWGERVAQRMPNARHLVVKGHAHGVTSVGCMPDLIAEFIAGTELAQLDAMCLDQAGPPAFFVGLGGPQP